MPKPTEFDFVEPEQVRYANLMLYGPPKTGKSAGAGTAPGRVLYLNADKRNATMYLHKHDTENRIKEPNMPRWDKENPSDKPVQRLMNRTAHSAMKGEWDTIVADPMGELYRRLLIEESKGSVRPSLPQRGDAGSFLERWCDYMCDAPVNFVMVAHEIPVQDGDELLRLPFCGSQNNSKTLGNRLLGMVDIIGYTAVTPTEDGDKQFVAQLVQGSANGRQGGDRFDVLGDWRVVDLTEWFALCGVHTGTTKKEK
jgi:hypothetical protein